MSLETSAQEEGRGGPLEVVRGLYPRLVLALDGKLLLLSCAVGVLSALLATVYFYALAFFMKGSEHLGEHIPVWALMPAVGALVGLSYFLGEPGETDAVVDNIHVRHGRIDTKANIPLMPISLLSIAAGGSAGPEAPMVYLTGSVGTWLHKWLKLPEAWVRTLTLTGMAVGFGTLFGAPVGAALFALEIPHKRGIEYYEATVPSMIGCLVGSGVFALLTGHGIGQAWHFPAYQFHHVSELFIAAGVGAVCGLAAIPYGGLIRGVKAAFKAIPGPMMFKGALGGAILGVIAWKLPATRFWGEEQLQTFLLDASPGITLLVVLGVAKMLTVSVTLASGWRGGIIIPCFFIGACLGKALALWLGLDPTLAMIAGMAAVNVAVMKVPLATIVVLATMTGVSAIAPLAAAGFAAFVVSGGVEFLESKRGRATPGAVTEPLEAREPEAA